MTENRLSDSTVKFLRWTSVICGCLLLLAAILANTSGMSMSSGISRNQIGFVTAGLLLIFAGSAGRKFPRIYKGTGVLILNIIVAVLILEIISIITVKVICHREFSIRQRKIEEGHLEEVERMTMEGLYAPFVVWRSNPAMNSDSVTVDESGYRNTPGNPEETEASTVMLLGGSSMWGTGVADRQTIAAHLQQMFHDRTPNRVRVVNLGQTAFCTTQELIELILQLREGNVPDVVVFYDGFNDVWGAYEAGRAGTHHSEQAIAGTLNGTSREEGVENIALSLLGYTNTWLMISTLRDRYAPEVMHYSLLETYKTMGVSSDSLAHDVLDVYLSNMEIVHALSVEYGFTYIFVVQPSLWHCGKTATEYEQEVLAGSNTFFLAGADPAFSELFGKTYNLFCEAAESREDFISYANIFDRIEETVFTDYSGAHVTGWANELIAESLFTEIDRIAPALIR